MLAVCPTTTFTIQNRIVKMLLVHLPCQRHRSPPLCAIGGIAMLEALAPALAAMALAFLDVVGKREALHPWVGEPPLARLLGQLKTMDST